LFDAFHQNRQIFKHYFRKKTLQNLPDDSGMMFVGFFSIFSMVRRMRSLKPRGQPIADPKWRMF
jgi:hypothetical protein